MIKNLSIGGSNRTMLMLALVFGAVCAVLVGLYLSNLSSDGGSSVSAATVPVVVAGQDIAPQTTITTDMVSIKEVPTDLVLSGGFTDVTQVIGKKTQVALVSGQQVLTTNAIDAGAAVQAYGDDAPLSLVIPDGLRAFAIYVSPVAAVGGLARSGDHVDVIVSNSTTAVNEAGESTTTTTSCYAVQDAAVLAMDQTILKPAAEGDASALAGVDAVPTSTAMTLAVTNQQTLQLAALQLSIQNGTSIGRELWVALRAFGDHTPNTDLPTCPFNTGS